MRAPTATRIPARIRDLAAVALLCVAAVAASGTHVVRSGETLGSIASRNGTTVRAIVEANGIKDPNLIVVGQSLQVPGSSGSSSGKSVTHRVARGETLASIASKYRTSVSALAKANGISNPNLIRIGASLQVSGSGSSGSTPAAQPSGGGGSSGPQLSGQRHTVASGDTIAGIARRYGLRSADIAAWNGLVDGRIYATTRLLLFNPGSLPGTKAASAGGSHTVARGQTLGGIASRYGVSSSAIVKASGISDPNRIRIGQVLTIPGGTASSGVVCPVAGGSFFNDWGFPRSGGRSHAGNDIFAPEGTPVRAPVAGDVDIATGTIGGKQFRLTAPDGSRWYGSHMSAFGATGQVRAGDVIGYVGDTGNARGSRDHLHFEVHVGGNAVNPYPLLRAAC